MIRAYHQPQRLEEALGLMAKGAVPVAGATSLYSSRNKPDAELVDITRLGLGSIQVEPGRISIGATVTLTQLVEATELPGAEGELLRRAAGSITARPMRNAITVGGNIAHVACWSDLPVALLALEAEVEIQRAGEPSSVKPLADCLKGQAPWAGGLITRVLVPVKGGARGFGYERFSRTSNDYPMASACATLTRDGEIAREVRLVVGALQPRAFRVLEVEEMLEGKAFTAELLDAAAAKLREVIQVAPNFRASADYRRELAGTLARRALHNAFSSVTREK